MACTRTVMMLWVCDSHPKMYIVRAHVQRTVHDSLLNIRRNSQAWVSPFIAGNFSTLTLLWHRGVKRQGQFYKIDLKKVNQMNENGACAFIYFAHFHTTAHRYCFCFFFDDFFSLYAPFWMFDFSLAYLSNLTLSSVPLFTYFVVRSLR